MIEPHTLCREGQPIGQKEGRLLRLLGYELGTFRMWVEAEWRDSNVTEHAAPPEEVAALAHKESLGVSAAAAAFDDGMGADMMLPSHLAKGAASADLPPDDDLDELESDEEDE